MWELRVGTERDSFRADPKGLRAIAMHGPNADRRDKRRLAARPLDTARPAGAAAYRLLDISPSGCLLESRESLGEVSCTVRLSLPLPKGDAREPLTARIVRKTERTASDEQTGFLYALRFEEMDPESEKTLRLYLDFLRRDSHVTSLDEAWRRLRSGRTVTG